MAKGVNKLTPVDLPADEDKDDEGRSIAKAGPSREGYRIAAFWKQQVDSYEQGARKWTKTADKIVKRFRDNRKHGS